MAVSRAQPSCTDKDSALNVLPTLALSQRISPRSYPPPRPANWEISSFIPSSSMFEFPGRPIFNTRCGRNLHNFRSGGYSECFKTRAVLRDADRPLRHRVKNSFRTTSGGDRTAGMTHRNWPRTRHQYETGLKMNQEILSSQLTTI